MSDMGAPPPPPPSGGGNPPPPPPGGGSQPPPPGFGTPPPPSGVGASPPVAQAVQASFGQRLGALVIDGLILGVPFAIISLIVVNMVPTEFVLCENDTAICEQPTSGGFAILFLVWAAYIGVAVWYFGTFEGIRTQTVGKRTLGIKTIRTGTDEPLGFGRGVGRYFAHIISALVCYLGYFWMIWDPDSQCWHDKIADSQVVVA